MCVCVHKANVAVGADEMGSNFFPHSHISPLCAHKASPSPFAELEVLL